MSGDEIRRGEVVIASVGTILYCFMPDGLKILAGERQNEPWVGTNLFIFGGLVSAQDETVEQAALREAKEETSPSLEIQIRHFIGCYGPKSVHYRLTLTDLGELVAIPTKEEMSRYKFVMLAFAGEVTGGYLITRPNQESGRLSWIAPKELAANGKPYAFDSALILADFYNKLRHESNFAASPVIKKALWDSGI